MSDAPRTAAQRRAYAKATPEADPEFAALIEQITRLYVEVGKIDFAEVVGLTAKHVNGLARTREAALEARIARLEAASADLQKRLPSKAPNRAKAGRGRA